MEYAEYVSFWLTNAIFLFPSKVACIETDFQRIDIYDVIEKDDNYAMYQRSLSKNGSYESRNPSLFRPDRIVMLDGWIQSSLVEEAAYHEALVHPAMFAHPDPKRVAIIGGGEAATLREVLKHKSVQDAIMIEIDEMIVKASRKHLPEWSNCTEFGTDWCVEDPRAEMYYEDALAWFLHRYPHGKNASAKPMDIIIMDALYVNGRYFFYFLHTMGSYPYSSLFFFVVL